MPLTVTGVNTEPDCSNGSGSLEIALINNMPDLVVGETEAQFFELLNAASAGLNLRLTLFSLPKIPRGDQVRRRMAQAYRELDYLWGGSFDAMIITGTEPRHADLRQEPFWPVMADVLDWAQENTVSTILSCLAAHAGVLHNDGIPREALQSKQFGIFEFQKNDDHFLTCGTSDILSFPHSRWNEVRIEPLKSCGYRVLSQSAAAGVDLFTKKKKQTLFVHFQGHPEYRNETLLREYRRDVKRFLKGAREIYPTTPAGYLDSADVEALSRFRENAIAQRSDALMSEFPEVAVNRDLGRNWQFEATQIYRNWLEFVKSRRAAPVRSLIPRVGAVTSLAKPA